MTTEEWATLKPNDVILFVHEEKFQAKYRLEVQDHLKSWIATRIDFNDMPISVRILKPIPEHFVRQ